MSLKLIPSLLRNEESRGIMVGITHSPSPCTSSHRRRTPFSASILNAQILKARGHLSQAGATLKSVSTNNAAIVEENNDLSCDISIEVNFHNPGERSVIYSHPWQV
jgi:hypothetical protein